MDLWHTFDEQGGGAVTQEFGLEGETYPDMLDPDDSHIIPNAGMQVELPSLRQSCVVISAVAVCLPEAHCTSISLQ